MQAVRKYNVVGTQKIHLVWPGAGTVENAGPNDCKVSTVPTPLLVDGKCQVTGPSFEVTPFDVPSLDVPSSDITVTEYITQQAYIAKLNKVSCMNGGNHTMQHHPLDTADVFICTKCNTGEQVTNGYVVKVDDNPPDTE